MKKIMRKLRSRTGASMILALVFLLFTTFVGSTVLVSATSNAYRVAHLSDQQAYLSERSAALLMADELRVPENKRMQLNVVDSVKSTQEVNITAGGGVVPTAKPPKVERVITFQAPANITPTPMQRLLLECTVWRYLRENVGADAHKVVLINFPENDQTKFWYIYDGLTVTENPPPIEGTIEISGTTTLDDVDIAYPANFTSGKDSELYDFMVDFGEYSQLRVTLNAFSGTSEEITLVSPASEDNVYSSTGYVQVTTTSTQTVISWDEPYIEKGGAES